MWRKEELKKVIIHELLHSLQIDKNIKPLSLNMNIQKSLNINETFIEIIAEILYYIYLNLEYNLNLSELVELEHKFSISIKAR